MCVLTEFNYFDFNYFENLISITYLTDNWQSDLWKFYKNRQCQKFKKFESFKNLCAIAIFFLNGIIKKDEKLAEKEIGEKENKVELSTVVWGPRLRASRMSRVF